MNGKSLPKQKNLRALAKMLSVDVMALQYGEEGGRKLRDPAATEWKAGALDQLAIDTYLALPLPRRQLVRALIDALAEGTSGGPR